MSRRSSAKFWLNGTILFSENGEIRESARAFLAEVLLEMRVPLAGSCWTLPGLKHNPEEYRMFSIGKRTFMGHRFSYQVFKGPIAAGLRVRHTCDNPPCCNSDHLLTGTDLENSQDKVLRGRHKFGANHHFGGATHCNQGHEFTPENTYVFHDKKKGGNARICRTCAKKRGREYAAQARARKKLTTG